MGFYNRVRGENEESSNLIAPAAELGQRHAGDQAVESETIINLIKNQTCIRTYQGYGFSQS